MLNSLLKIAFGGLIIWGTTTWLGAGLTALGIAVLAALIATLGLGSSNNHATELQQLRERLRTIEENLNSAHERFSDDIDRMKEENRKLSERLYTMMPNQLVDDY